MHIEDFRNYCLSLKKVTEDTPFGPNTLVFKVMGKMFALTDITDFESVNLKCDPEKAIELREQYDAVKPGYHMNKKHWNTITINGDMNDKELREWVFHSYNLVVSGMPKRLQKELEE
ncbi:MmcQ/YjbR family DNA-binding protein [Flammeovirgaceae bacterium SG7u.111]|nr:MmcQ/YjbR family DNA-binding protein [Flammeovirgaceae bacterium SG7u.132]WPO34151.1 MmcQ/YjbR family DNA-binding protein [Flammeovirgaceae bacterium SG7u.111]